MGRQGVENVGGFSCEMRGRCTCLNRSRSFARINPRPDPPRSGRSPRWPGCRFASFRPAGTVPARRNSPPSAGPGSVSPGHPFGTKGAGSIAWGGKGVENVGGIFWGYGMQSTCRSLASQSQRPLPTPSPQGGGARLPRTACPIAGISTDTEFEIGKAVDAGLSPSPLWGGVLFSTDKSSGLRPG